MTLKTTPCLRQHLVDKAKTPNVVAAVDWLNSAKRHHKSASLILNHDPAGALQLAWSAMHDLAKCLSADVGYRLDDETHGKVADFLACAYGDDLTDKEVGLIRTIHVRRNRSSYDDPKVPQSPLIGESVNLAKRMIALADEAITT